MKTGPKFYESKEVIGPNAPSPHNEYISLPYKNNNKSDIQSGGSVPLDEGSNDIN